MTFTTNHDHEDQRWMHAHTLCTFDAYHACLEDLYYKHFDFSTFLLSTLLFTGFFTTSDTHEKGWSFHHRQSAFFSLHGLHHQRGKARRPKHDEKISLTKTEPLISREKEFSFFFFFFFGDWIFANLPVSRKIYPHGPDFCLFFFSFSS